MFCTNCGKAVDENSKFCINCGTKITSPSAIKREMPPEIKPERKLTPAKKRRLPGGVIAVIIVMPILLVLVASVLIFMLLRGKPNETEKITSWEGITDWTDTDEDGLPDELEKKLKTNPKKEDTDGDGLSDYVEVVLLDTNPLKKDSDKNGVPDGEEDKDGDELLNREEVDLGTSPLYADTDGDLLPDGEEVEIYDTDPLNPDSDGDGLSDGREVLLGTDPCQWDTEFITLRETEEISEFNPISVSASVVTDAAGADSLMILPIEDASIPALLPGACGYLGTAFEFETDGELAYADVTFAYDTALGTIGEDFLPTIYYYDYEENELVEVEDQMAVDGLVSAKLYHFSTYALFNKAELELFNNFLLPTTASRNRDENRDGLPDDLIKYLDNGKVKFNNSNVLVGLSNVVDITSDDWDGDGLKNGEEINFYITLTGKLKLSVKSNPLLKDSDQDGLDDFQEVKQTFTNPMRKDHRSVGALHQLENDGKYSYTLHRDHFEEGLAVLFDVHRFEQANECLINYFYNYAPQETLEKNAEAIARQTEVEDLQKTYGLIANLFGIAEDIVGVVSDGTEVADLKNTLDEEINLQKNMLDELNYGKAEMKLSADFMRQLTFPDKLENVIKALEADDKYKQVDELAGLISAAKSALSVYKQALKFEQFSLAREFGDYSKAAKQLGANYKLPEGPSKLSVIVDIMDIGQEMTETYTTYSKIKANMDAYNMYLEMLLDIANSADNFYVREPALKLAISILDNSGFAYFLMVQESCYKAVEWKAKEIVLREGAKKNAYVAVAYMFVKLYGVIGMNELARSNVYFDVMAEITKSSKKLLSRAITRTDQTFAYDADAEGYVDKYLVQLAQSRIMGEYYYYEYCAQDTLPASISNFLTGTNKEDYKQMGKDKIREIYDYSNRLQLKLSSNLPYYKDFWRSDVPEDDIILSWDESFVMKKAAGYYVYASGAGAWMTELTLNEDGSFEGYYYDLDMGSSGERDGTAYAATQYELTFNGKFKIKDQIDDQCFLLEITEYQNAENEGDYWFEDTGGGNFLYHVASASAGYEVGTKFTLFAPDAYFADYEGYELPWQFFGNANTEHDFALFPENSHPSMYFMRMGDQKHQ